MCEKKGARGGTDLELAAQSWNRKKPSLSLQASPQSRTAQGVWLPTASWNQGWGSPGRASWRRGASHVTEMVGSLQLTHCGCTSAGFPCKKRSR